MLGVVTEATLRLIPKPASRAMLAAIFPDFAMAAAAVQAILDAGHLPSALETPLLQLVQSFRDQQCQPRQRVIASLGDAQLPENEERPIALAVQSRLQGEQDLFEADLSKEALNWVARIVALAARSKASAPLGTASVDGVLIDQIETEQVMEFGPELVALEAWEKLGLTPILADLGFNASSIATAKLMVANRLIEPLSEWALINWRHEWTGIYSSVYWPITC